MGAFAYTLILSMITHSTDNFSHTNFLTHTCTHSLSLTHSQLPGTLSLPHTLTHNSLADLFTLSLPHTLTHNTCSHSHSLTHFLAHSLTLPHSHAPGKINHTLPLSPHTHTHTHTHIIPHSLPPSPPSSQLSGRPTQNSSQ